MGKASSSKKVAKAAKAGGSLRERPKLGYPLALFVIVVLGVALVAYARADRLDSLSSQETPVKNQDHWHAAYGIYVCDHFLPPLTDVKETDPDGIHTHGDGVIHVHPFSTKGAGKNAKLKVFGEMVGMKFGSDYFEVNGEKYGNGYKCGDKDARVQVVRWANADDESVVGEVFGTDPGEVRIRNDRSAITIAIVPDGTDIPRPETIPALDSLTDVPSTSQNVPSGIDNLTIPTNAITPESSVTTVAADPNATPTTAVADPNATPTTAVTDPAAAVTTVPAADPSTPPSSN